MRNKTIAIALLALVGILPANGSAQVPDSVLTRQLTYRFVGPDGNRAIAVAGNPGDPMVAYIGAASGGLFKTTDGGRNWRPIFDDQGVSSVGSIAIAPSNNNVVWIGTGETFIIRPAHSIGTGVYRSNDAGKHWAHVGLDETGRIGRMVVDPRNEEVAFACALGHTYGPQPERGVYRTTDGGTSWELVLHVDDNTGCIDLSMDPNNPRVLFAGMWQVSINTWGLNSGGPGGGVFVSRDGGNTWKRVAGGLPGGDKHPVGKVAVGVAPSNSQRVYALFEDKDPGFYRSDDGGEHWKLISQNHTLAERAPYYTRFAVSPDDENRLYFVSVRFSMSIDGGASIVPRPPRGGGDNHDIWIDPSNPDRIMVADDGGANISLNRGRTFERINLPIAQVYHVRVDNQIPYYLYGNRQDGYSYRGPSNSRAGGNIPVGLWRTMGGCESGFATPDPVDNDIVWSGCYDGGLERWDLKTGQVRNVRVWPEAGYGWAPADLEYRWHWNFPIAISPHDHNRVYVGSQYVHLTTDAGQSWSKISPDLTTNDKSHQQSSGGIAIDNLMTFDGSTLFAIAESPVQEGVIWAGTNDGQVSVTLNGGGNWTNVTEHIPDLPKWGTVASIDPSHFDAGTAYIAVDLHQMGDFDPYLFKTTDFGKNWKRINSDIPRSVLSFTHVLKEDPARQGLLYAGTDNGLYVSLNDGKHWMPLRNNMPPAPVYWLTIQEHFSDLVVATYGRGFYILDDLTPLRALDSDVIAADAYLFQPRQAYRFRTVTAIKTESGSNVVGRNPRYGADINYFLQKQTKDTVTITILDQAGDTVRKLTGPKRQGINRTWWDLRYEASKKAKLRTPPPGKDFVPLGPDGTRRLVTWDLDLNAGQRGPLAPPGTYTVTLKVGDAQLTQQLEVLKDPHSAGSEADIRAQVQLSLQLRDELDEVVDMIDQLEWLRKQMKDMRSILEGNHDADTVIAAAGELAKKAIAVEGHLFDVHLTGAREDAFRNPMKLYGRLSALASDVGANSADFAPTTQQIAVHELFMQRLAEYRRQFRALFDTDVAAFKRLVREKELPHVISLGR
ncbi:MAG: glycosyl hydrolase [Gemmatimonadales bacterium]